MSATIDPDAARATGEAQAQAERERLAEVNARAAEKEAAFGALEDDIVELASHINAATARLLARVAELDRGGVVTAPDTTAGWLAWRLSLRPAVARDYVRVAAALEVLPALSGAFASGELSYDKVSCLTRIATVDNEDTLLMWARNGTAAQMARIVTSYEQAQAAESLEELNARHDARFVTHHFDHHGDFVLKGRLPAEDGAVIACALEWAIEHQEDANEPYDARRADALVALAEAALRADGGTGSGPDRYQVVVHVDADSFAGNDHDGARNELVPDVSINPETARRLGCDSSVVELVESAGEVLSIGRKTRRIPVAMRRAMVARDRGCVWPGCTNRRYVEGHHVTYWRRGGATALANLASLCRRHHRRVHEGGYDLRRRPEGTFEVVDPGGSVLEASPPIGPPGAPLGPLHRATVPRTYVDPCDYDSAVRCLLPRQQLP